MIRKALRVLFLGVVGACAQDPTLEVVNTSGRRQAVMAFDRSLADLYWVDSVDAGHSVCWRIPKFAQNEHILLAITPVMTESEVRGVLPRPAGWSDSVILSRSRSFRVHGPGAERPVDRTEGPACRPR